VQQAEFIDGVNRLHSRDMLIVHAVRSFRPAQIIREQFLCSGRIAQETHYDVRLLVDSAVIDSSIGSEGKSHFLP